MKVQTIIGLLSVLLLSAIAVTTGTTTQILQPAYSQAQHCTTRDLDGALVCTTPGQDASTTTCIRGETIICTPEIISPQEAGQRIGDCHSGPAQCIVRHP